METKLFFPRQIYLGPVENIRDLYVQLLYDNEVQANYSLLKVCKHTQNNCFLSTICTPTILKENQHYLVLNRKQNITEQDMQQFFTSYQLSLEQQSHFYFNSQQQALEVQIRTVVYFQTIKQTLTPNIYIKFTGDFKLIKQQMCVILQTILFPFKVTYAEEDKTTIFFGFIVENTQKKNLIQIIESKIKITEKWMGNINKNVMKFQSYRQLQLFQNEKDKNTDSEDFKLLSTYEQSIQNHISSNVSQKLVLNNYNQYNINEKQQNVVPQQDNKRLSNQHKQDISHQTHISQQNSFCSDFSISDFSEQHENQLIQSLSEEQKQQYKSTYQKQNQNPNNITIEIMEYPRVIIQISVQQINIKQLLNELSYLNQVQQNATLIKQVNLDYFFFIGLLFPLSQTDIQKLTKKVKDFDEKYIEFNKNDSLTSNQLKKFVGEQNVKFMEYSNQEVLFCQKLHFDINYQKVQSFLPLQLAFKANNRLLQDISDLLNTFLTQYSLKQHGQYYGITTAFKKSENFWKKILQKTNISQYQYKIMNRRFFNNDFENYYMILSNQLESHYSKNDYKNLLSQIEIDNIMRLSLQIQLYQATITKNSNIIIFDFEFFLTTSTTIVPLEIGILRVQQGKIQASYRTFLIPTEDIICQLTYGEQDKLKNHLLKPMCTDMSQNEQYRRLNPISIQLFVQEMHTFIQGSAEEIKQKINYNRYTLYYDQLTMQKPDIFISKGTQSEKQVFYSINQTFIAENIQEFENLIKCQNENYKQPAKEDLHNNTTNQNKCLYHLLSNNHCALNDVINLGNIVIQQLFK